ncbi:AsmA family protein [Crenobacter sp. SG2305]|uniref:AsmA family protein n=1 Tax=Crenobacter oryzisoli TaxID=3056844 RepID=UPI0025AAD5C1|nr:AsmA family protein [Crenobacter sp. SG2305]MDN0082813.1 AsmA family protein [Crenobacter sp. SG2305]
MHSRTGRIITRTVVALIALLAVLIAAAVVVLATFDWNRVRPWVDDKVSQAIARPFAINGDLKISWRRPSGETGWRAWVPWPRFSASRIVIGNPDWAKRKDFATLDQVDFEVEAWPLTEQRIVIPVINLVNPSLDLERLRDGRNNWTFKPPSAKPTGWTLALHDIAFAKGHIAYADELTQANLQATVDTLGKPIPFAEVLKQQAGRSTPSGATVRANPAPAGAQPYALGLVVKGSYKGTAMDGDGKLGGLLALQDASRPFPIHANLRYGDTRIAAVGTLTDPMHLAALDLRLWLSGVSMAHLYPLTGLTLPATPPYATDGHLSGHLRSSGSVFKYENFTGRVGSSDLSGSLSYAARQPRPLLTGDVVSKQLRFVDLAPLIGADTKASKLQRGDTTAQPAGKKLPVERFRTERWASIDADVRFTGQRIIRQASLPLQNLSTHLTLKDGVLSLDPLRFGVAGGELDSTLRLDGRRAPMAGRMNLSVRHVKLKQLFPTIAVMQSSFGELQGDAELSATGNSVAALLGSSNGEVKLLMNNGAISGTLLEEAGLNVANIVLYKLFGDKTVKIHCAAADFVATQGRLDSRLFAIDTEDALITISGQINLATERMDLTVHPQAKGLRVLSLRSPLYVKGSFSKPDVGVNTGVLLLRGGSALGLVLLAPPLAALLPLTAISPGSDTSCQTMLARMRTPPRVPAKAGR